MVECSSYDRLILDKKMTDRAPGIRPAGTSAIKIEKKDDEEKPSTPPGMRKYRVNTNPGEVITHWGLKDQKLPTEDFVYGIKGDTGESVEQIFNKAAEITQGMAEYKNDRKEEVYASKKREPLGTCYTRGHVLPPEVHSNDFRGFGLAVDHPVDMAKNALYPRDQEPETEEIRQQYVRTHGNYGPGEMIKREYNWPKETKDDSFRFGVTDREEGGREGDATKAALNMEIEDDGAYPRTVIVQKNVDDFRHRDHDHIGKSHNLVYEYPPVPVNMAFGKASGERDSTTEICIKGEFSKEAQQPDADLGKCIKVGRRNFTDDPRVYGTPSVRSDIPAPPPEKRSLADNQNYGDEAGTGPLLNPTKFEGMGVSGDVFLLRREKGELRSILKSAGYEYDDDTYGRLWAHATALFEDELDLASVDSVLHITKQGIAEQVAQDLGAR